MKKLETITLDLSPYVLPSNKFLLGRENGKKAYNELNIDKYIYDNDCVMRIVVSDCYGALSSFIEGFFESLIHHITYDDIVNKFQFKHLPKLLEISFRETLDYIYKVF